MLAGAHTTLDDIDAAVALNDPRNGACNYDTLHLRGVIACWANGWCPAFGSPEKGLHDAVLRNLFFRLPPVSDTLSLAHTCVHECKSLKWLTCV